jgi:hypothetical protein
MAVHPRLPIGNAEEAELAAAYLQLLDDRWRKCRRVVALRRGEDVRLRRDGRWTVPVLPWLQGLLPPPSWRSSGALQLEA